MLNYILPTLDNKVALFTSPETSNHNSQGVYSYKYICKYVRSRKTYEFYFSDNNITVHVYMYTDNKWLHKLSRPFLRKIP